ncbi:MAG: carbohydrate-binding family 9-like protein [Candidatus Omnitrophota bacterium]
MMAIMKTKLSKILAGSLMFLALSLNDVSAKGPHDAPPPTYTCYRISTAVTVDGKLSEAFWKDIPRMQFGELVSGGPPWFDCYCKVVWDDKYLYIAFWGGDPDVAASVDRDAARLPEELPLKKRSNGVDIGPSFAGLPLIMLHDPLFMAFIDPDADGRNYEEFHINALNNVNDWWFEQGSNSREFQNLDCGKNNLHLGWDCEGLQHAVCVYGTLNDPSDTDVGWSAELAVPFSALKQFTRGSIPPKPGDKWAIHTGWEYRSRLDKPETDRSAVIYWTWPIIGVLDDHQLWRYGEIVFSDSPNYSSK